MNLDLGTVGDMGPGYFPVLLGSILGGLGAILVVRCMQTGLDPIGVVPWKGLLLITLAIGFFGATVRTLGVGPAFFGSILLACFATERINLVTSLVVSLLLTVGCLVVFVYALRLPYPVFGPWIRGY